VPIRAFLFDFDGLILDTESAALSAWQNVYREHGRELPLEQWATNVGSRDSFDPMAHLEALIGAALEHDPIHERRRAHELTLLEAEELRPGIAEYLAEAERRGLKRAIVSSSSQRWIHMHLARLERTVGWDAIVAADDDASRAKPRPDLYLEALDVLGVAAAEAVAFEDSLNGIRAAQAAGIFCVAVPNAVTRTYALDQADLFVESLAQLPPGDLLSRFES
jgi:HAD superfamily hydrolase (TIGR01509 family)